MTLLLVMSIKNMKTPIGSKGHNPDSLEQRNRMKVYIYNGVFYEGVTRMTRMA